MDHTQDNEFTHVPNEALRLYLSGVRGYHVSQRWLRRFVPVLQLLSPFSIGLNLGLAALPAGAHPPGVFVWIDAIQAGVLVACLAACVTCSWCSSRALTLGTLVVRSLRWPARRRLFWLAEQLVAAQSPAEALATLTMETRARGATKDKE